MPWSPATYFLLTPPASGTLIYGEHQPLLVMLSVLVAILCATVSLQMAGVARRSEGQSLRNIALATGTLALGLGVWSMHFIGMLAFDLCVTVGYDRLITLASMLPSLGAAGVAMVLIARKTITRGQLALGGVVVGAGIGAMHYAGMAAMDMAPLLRYDPGWFLASIVVAVVLAVLALWIRFELRRQQRITGLQSLLAGGTVMGLAISGMHYTAMQAARFVGQPEVGYVPDLGRNSSLALGIALGTLMVAVLAGAVIAALRYRSLASALSRNEARLQAVLDTAVDGVISIDGRGTILSFNPAAERIFGWTSAEVLGQNIKQLMPEPTCGAHDGYLAAYEDTGVAKIIGTGRDVVAQRKDGSRVPVRLAIGRAVDGAQATYVGFVTDISARQRMEQALRASEVQYRSLIENVPGATFRTEYASAQGGLGRQLYISDAITRITGWTPEEHLAGQVNNWQLVHPADLPRVRQDIHQHLSSQGHYQTEYRLRHRDGTVRWVAESGSLSPEEGPETVRTVQGILMDITESKLRNADFESVVRAIRRALMVIEFDLDGLILHANENFLHLTGYTAEELIGQPHTVLCLPEQVTDPAYQAHWAALRRGEFQAGEFQRRGKHGREIWIHATYNPILDAQGQPQRIIKFVNDMTERQALEVDLRQSRDRAEQAAQAKSTFLANMSHEIRTPMNAIIGFAEVVLEGELQPRQREHLGTIHRAAKSLLGLLNDILDTAKLEQGAVELELRDFSLRDLCRELLATLRLSAEKKGLALQLDYPDSVGEHFVGDALRLQQVLLNLLGNAIKFTERGSVSLQVTADSPVGLTLSVTDTGIGIAPERLERIFDPFAQADASVTRRFGGTGLGTTIARQLVQLMGGQIGVESEPGRGSRFWITLPLRPGQAPADSTVLPPTLALPPLTLLVADDVPQNLELLALRLGRLGHTVHTASNGEDALSLLHTHRFDAVLMDVQMPVLDGLATTRRWRAFEVEHQRVHTPIIALTASVLEEDRRATEEAGMDGFAVKPVDLPQLLAELARVLKLAAPVPPPSAPATTPPADAAIFWAQGLERWGDEATLVRQILRWLPDAYHLVSQARKPALDAATRAQAHRLRGAAANLALVEIQDLATQIEHLPDGADHQAEPLWDRLQAALEQLERRMQARAPSSDAPAEPIPPSHTAPDREVVASLQAALRRGECPDTLIDTVAQSLPPPDQHALRAALNDFDLDRAAQVLSPWAEPTPPAP